jgi:GT2 family glycosyltransferase
MVPWNRGGTTAGNNRVVEPIMTDHYNVVIATPGYSMKSEYVKSLVETTRELQSRGLTYTLINKYSSFVATARELTALDSYVHDYDSTQIARGSFTYDKIFWIDSDIEWTVDDFMRLYDSELEVVSGLYQLDQLGSVAVGYPNKIGTPTRVNKVEFLLHDEPVEVGGVGFGFVAMKSGVFELIPRPWFLIAKVRWEEDRDLMVNMGEDYSWCERAKQSGFKIWVDPQVKVRHHKETVYEI